MLVLSTSCLYRNGLNRIFELAAQAGFDGIEIVMNEVFDTHDAEYINLLSSSFKVPVISVQYRHPEKDAHIRESIALAESVGAQLVVAGLPAWANTAFTKWYKENMPDIQERSRIPITVENQAHGDNLLLPKYAMSNINELKRFKHVCLNTSSLVSNKEDLMRVYSNIKPRLSAVHLSNYSGAHENFVLEKGLLPLESFLTALRTDNMQIPIIVNVHARLVSNHDKARVLENLKAMKVFYDKYYLGQDVVE